MKTWYEYDSTFRYLVTIYQNFNEKIFKFF
jgi:hypothetical protein